MSTRVADAHRQWWINVGPPGAGAIQAEEMKRAFYSGAFAMMTLVVEAAGETDDDEAGIDEAANFMEGVNKELADFLTNLSNG